VVDAALDADPAYRPRPAELRDVLRDVQGELSDDGGLVEPETIERFGLTAVRARTRVRTLLHRAPAVDGETEQLGVLGRMGSRALAGLATGILLFAGLEGLGPAPPFSSAAVALAGGMLVAVLPRVGWVLSALFLCGWLGTPEADRPGTALLLAAALAPTPLLLPRAGLLWSVPALAPRRVGRRGVRVARRGRGAHGRPAALRDGRRHARAGALGGLPGRRRG